MKQKIQFDDVVKQRGIKGVVNFTVKQPPLHILLVYLTGLRMKC